MPRVLLLVAADVEADRRRAAAGDAPARDYGAVAAELGADLLDAASVRRGWLRRLLARSFGAGPAVALAAIGRAGAYDVVFSDSERIGMPLAALLRLYRARPRHVMLGHHLSPPKKRPFLRLARPAVDALIVHAEPQKRFAVEALGFAAERVHVLPYQVDGAFWQPAGEPGAAPLISSAGLELRDYETLVQAVRGLDVEVRIGAASYWSSKGNRLAGRTLPANVDLRPYAYRELRDLYARSRFVVVPLFETDFQAGVTLILEAMAMARAVIVSRTQGQRGVVRGPVWQAGWEEWPEDGEPLAAANGIYVPPGDAAALRSAIVYLLRRRDVAATLGANGSELARAEFSVEAFGRRFARVINHAASLTRSAAGATEQTEASVAAAPSDDPPSRLPGGPE